MLAACNERADNPNPVNESFYNQYKLISFLFMFISPVKTKVLMVKMDIFASFIMPQSSERKRETLGNKLDF